MLLELVRSRQPISGRARYYAHIVSNGCEAPSLDSAAVWQHFLNQERIRLDIDFGQGGYPCGFLNWTPDDARRHPDIRDPYLQSRWAKENGLDLQEMADQRKCIYAWTGMADAISSLFKRFMATMGNGPESLQLPKAPSPAMLEMAKASDLEFGASIRFRVTFAEEHQEAWLTACRRRGPEPDELAEFGAAQERIVTLETIKGEQGQVLRKLNSVDKKTDQVLSGVQVLTGLAGEQAAARTEHVSAILALPETLTKAGQQARADVEAGASTLGARTKDLAETLGKVAEVFADPLVAAAKDASINRAVPPEFALWVFYERHFAKFPTVDGAYKRCGLGPKLEKDGFAFSRPTVGRWLKIIRDELEERKLIQKRNLDRGAVKARGFDVAQAKDTSPLPGDGDEPPDDFVEWTQEKHAAGAMPSEEDVLDWLCARTDSSILDSCSSDKLREIAKKWLRQAEKILDLDRTDPPEPEDDSDPEDDS